LTASVFKRGPTKNSEKRPTKEKSKSDNHWGENKAATKKIERQGLPLKTKREYGLLQRERSFL